MTQPSQPGTEVDTTLQLSKELVQQFAQMAMAIPGETTDALDSIIGAILGAPSWEHLSDPWESSKAELLAGRTLRIDGLSRRPSDYRDGLGIFLVVHYTDTRTGEPGVWTTGSTACVAQLARAYAAGWLPLYAQIVIAERPTKEGYKPHHLKFLGKADKPAGEKMPF